MPLPPSQSRTSFCKPDPSPWVEDRILRDLLERGLVGLGADARRRHPLQRDAVERQCVEVGNGRWIKTNDKIQATIGELVEKHDAGFDFGLRNDRRIGLLHGHDQFREPGQRHKLGDAKPEGAAESQRPRCDLAHSRLELQQFGRELDQISPLRVRLIVRLLRSNSVLPTVASSSAMRFEMVDCARFSRSAASTTPPNSAIQ